MLDLFGMQQMSTTAQGIDHNIIGLPHEHSPDQ